MATWSKLRWAASNFGYWTTVREAVSQLIHIEPILSIREDALGVKYLAHCRQCGTYLFTRDLAEVSAFRALGHFRRDCPDAVTARTERRYNGQAAHRPRPMRRGGIK
jgi:hypothetical protein